MAYRFGFGEKTGESETGGLDQYEDGHVDVSSNAFKFAVESYPGVPPAAAVGLALAEVGGIDPETFGAGEDTAPDWEALHDNLTEIDGVGEETADELMEVIQDQL